MAKQRIPESKRAVTPVTLKALLDTVTQRLEQSGFDNRGVGIARELEEGEILREWKA